MDSHMKALTTFGAPFLLARATLLCAVALEACAGDDGTGSGGTAAGAGGVAGGAGAGASGGVGTDAGGGSVGGNAGSAGSAGAGASGGMAGAAGIGGTAGAGGSGGTAGAGGGGGTAGAGGSGGTAGAGGSGGTAKFIPAGTVVFGGYNKCKTAQAAIDRTLLAKFDIIATGPTQHGCWGANGKNSWQSIKALNPSVKIVLYQLGPGEYDLYSYDSVGDGWSWIKQNHGDSATDRWTAKGVTYGTYLQSTSFSNERLMNLGNPNWQAYWYQRTYQDFWQGKRSYNGIPIDAAGADGIFSDNTGYWIPGCGSGLVKEGTSQLDNPVDYYASGKCDTAKWTSHLNAFFEKAVPWLGSKGTVLVPNFQYLSPQRVSQIDALTHPPFTLFDECSFTCPWGGFKSESSWKDRVDAVASAKKTRVWMHNGLKTSGAANGLAAMDLKHSSGERGWDALWFDIASFLLGYDPAHLSYFSYIPGGYDEVLWLDELDPKQLHLGAPLSGYNKVGAVYLREFQDGWAVVNPTDTAASGIAVPAGQARVINHDNFSTANAAPLVKTFSLPAKRGVILLKQGRLLGNADNP